MSAGIPNYFRALSAADLRQLQSRPQAKTDFVGGQFAVSTFNQIAFGDNIGYATSSCSQGYWPPGNKCPVAAAAGTELASHSFNLRPAAETSVGCYLPSNAVVGYWVNGVAMYSAVTGRSFNNLNLWHYVSPIYNKVHSCVISELVLTRLVVLVLRRCVIFFLMEELCGKWVTYHTVLGDLPIPKPKHDASLQISKHFYYANSTSDVHQPLTMSILRLCLCLYLTLFGIFCRQ